MPQKVAIIGSGLAGLTTAHILHADPSHRYALTIFEQAPSLSFDSASVSVRDNRSNSQERIDLPMRAAAGGYYSNLMSMYRYLSVPMHPVRFLFVFAKALSSSSSSSSSSLPSSPSSSSSSSSSSSPRQASRMRESESDKAASVPGCYFVHASNLHQTPPPWPANRGFLLHVVEILFLVVCQFWFTAACFLISPTIKPSTKLSTKLSTTSTTSKNSSSSSSVSSEGEMETLAEYLERIWLPRRYISHYLLPLMSSVSTCSHSELLEFPASDVINYKKLSQGQQHYVVCGGIGQVQSRLAEGITDLRLGVRVLNVEPLGEKVNLKWTSATNPDGKVEEQVFDRVILAVSPDVACRIFTPLQPLLSSIPTRQVESSVLDPSPGSHTIQPDSTTSNSSSVTAEPSIGCSHHTTHGNKAQVITFRTMFSESGSHTEALHAMPSGVIVQTCPLESESREKGVLQAARFTRTLRTTQSRKVVEGIMSPRKGEKGERGGERGWVNGEDNVWLTGAWCWDGMVLLEGCVVSAMRVARDFGVEVPWEK